MPDTLYISKVNEVHMHIDCEPGVAMELSDAFSFEIPNAKFNPKVKHGIWDGRIRLFNRSTRLMYFGLLNKVKAFASAREYEVVCDETIDSDVNISLVEVKEFAESVNGPHTLRDYQLEALAACIRQGRSLTISPTGSGKSYIIHHVLQYYRKRSLVIVPTKGLREQMYKDLIDYGTNPKHIQVSPKADEELTGGIVIALWQGIYKRPKEWFAQFDVVIGDEVHLFKAKSLIGIMESLESCKYRFGFTGTLAESKTDKMVLEGIFGTIKQFVKTKELINEQHLSDFRIRCLILDHKDPPKGPLSYQDEMDYLVSHEKRNDFICKLALSLKGNTLVLFQYVDKHGIPLYEKLKKKVDADGSGRIVSVVHGAVDDETREEVRVETELADDAIIVASYGTFSTGINIRNLHNLVFASPSKSRIRNLQSIGRVLRTADGKSRAVLYDISDVLRKGKKPNYTQQHFRERLKTYVEEDFSYKLYNIDLKR